MINLLNPRGLFGIEVLDKFGNLLQSIQFPNGVTNLGKNNLLDAWFRNQTQPTAWYFGIIDNSGYSSVAATDVVGSHAGWVEFTAYNEATRQQWSPGAAAAQSITNSTPASVTINATGTLRGLYIVSHNVKGDETTGQIWATALAPATIGVVSSNVVNLTYTVEL